MIMNYIVTHIIACVVGMHSYRITHILDAHTYVNAHRYTLTHIHTYSYTYPVATWYT